MRISTFDQFDMKNCNAYIADMLYNPLFCFTPYNASCDLKLDDFCEFTFDVPYYYVDDVTKKKYINPVYDYISCFRNVHLNDVGFFHINTVSIEGDGANESKHVTALSAEHNLTHKYSNEFNDEVNDMVLYDPDKPSKSAMHKILKDTEWSVAYCDEHLANHAVFLDVDRASRYDLMTNDIATLLDCKFIFDIENFEISIYPNDNIGEDTGLSITFDNLMQNAEVSYEEDDIKTALRVEGEGIYITDLNGGSDVIVDLSNYATEEWMGAELADKYDYYFKKRNDAERLKYYTEIQKYLDAVTKRREAIENNYPEDGLHLWEIVFQDEKDLWMLTNLEEQIYTAEQNKDSDEVNKLLDGFLIFINDYIFDCRRDSIYGKLIFAKRLLILSEYGIKYLKEGKLLLDELIKAEEKKLKNMEQRPNDEKYTYIHFYQLMSKFYSTALNEKYVVRNLYEIRLIPMLKKTLEKLSDYFSYEGFVHDKDFMSNNIFNLSSDWSLNSTFSDVLFNSDYYDIIIASTNYFGAIENFSEYFMNDITHIDNYLDENGKKIRENNICKDLYRTTITYKTHMENDEEKIDIIKESTPLDAITFNYYTDSKGCNPWIYDLFMHCFHTPKEDLLEGGIFTSEKNLDTYIQNKVGISGTPYFTDDEVRILKSLEIEEEYIDSNFKHYDSYTRAKILEQSKRLYKNGLKKLKNMNKPTLSFTADVANLFMLDSFKGIIWQHLFALGNKINIVLRGNYAIQVTIKELHVDFNEPENFSFTCDNAVSLLSNEYNSILRKIGKAYRQTKIKL